MKTESTKKTAEFKTADPIKDKSSLCVSFGEGMPCEIDGTGMVVIRAKPTPAAQKVCVNKVVGDIDLNRWGGIRELDDGRLCEMADIVVEDADIVQQVFRPVTESEAREALLERVPLLRRLFGCAEGTKGNNVYLTPGNLARLEAVGRALECHPSSLLNNFLCAMLSDPSTIVDGMDFTEDGNVKSSEARQTKSGIEAAAKALDGDGWEPDLYLP